MNIAQPTPATDAHLNPPSLPDVPKCRELADLVSARMTEEGVYETDIPGLDLFRVDAPPPCMSTVYEPSLCVIAQGRKTVQLGDREIVYGALTYVVSSVDLPVNGRVIDASPEHPFLAVKININPAEVAELVLQMGDAAPSAEQTECPYSGCGLCVAQVDLGILDAMSPRMREFVSTDSQQNRISRVISVLKDRFAEPLRVRELAEDVNMSESTLYHSFKQVTRMSPVQFQKKLRLHEARRLMLSEGLEAATASYRVGYESPSHFSREYSRMFGASPRADVIKLRGDARIHMPA